MVDGIDDPKLDSTTSHPSSSSHSLPRRVICHRGGSGSIFLDPTRPDPAQGQYDSKQFPDFLKSKMTLPEMTYCIG